MSFFLQLFKRLFAEGLKVQKERMQSLRSYAREQRENRAKQQERDVQALETFYKDQFGMLANNVAQERRNVEVRDAAQAKVSVIHCYTVLQLGNEEKYLLDIRSCLQDL